MDTFNIEQLLQDLRDRQAVNQSVLRRKFNEMAAAQGVDPQTYAGLYNEQRDLLNKQANNQTASLQALLDEIKGQPAAENNARVSATAEQNQADAFARASAPSTGTSALPQEDRPDYKNGAGYSSGPAWGSDAWTAQQEQNPLSTQWQDKQRRMQPQPAAALPIAQPAPAAPAAPVYNAEEAAKQAEEERLRKVREWRARLEAGRGVGLGA